MEMKTVKGVNFRDIYEFLKEIEEKRCNETEILIKNVKYNGITPNIQMHLIGPENHRSNYIHTIKAYNFADSGNLMIYLVDAIKTYFRQNEIIINIVFKGKSYSTANESDYVNYNASYNDFVDHVRMEIKNRRDKLRERELDIYKRLQFKKDVVNEINEKIENSKYLYELSNILDEYHIKLYRNNDWFNIFTKRYNYQSIFYKIEKIMVLINSRKNSYIISKLKSGDFKAEDVKQYPELIEAADELQKLKILTGTK